MENQEIEEELDQEIAILKAKRVELLKEKLRREKNDRLALQKPNAKQMYFISSACQGRTKAVMLSGPTQGGKTYALRLACAYHTTGRYPAGWEGHKFKMPEGRPLEFGLGGESTRTLREQLLIKNPEMLLGSPEDIGSGLLPREDILHLEWTKGSINNQLDYAIIQHYDENGEKDGESILHAFSYSGNWHRISGYTLDGVFLNEEPKSFKVWDELVARTTQTRGKVWIVFTPLNGFTELVEEFEKQKIEEDPFYRIVYYSIDEATHLTEEHREEEKERLKDHPFAQARLYGKPCAGEGSIYPIAADHFVEPFEVPEYWPVLIGLDLPHTDGSNSAFAAVKVVQDPETLKYYVTAEYKGKAKPPSAHAQSVIDMGGARVACAWPHDGHRQSGSRRIIDQYQKCGLRLNPEKAHMLDSTGAHVSSPTLVIREIIYGLFMEGRMHIFNSCPAIKKELNNYRLRDGSISTDEDHLIDAFHKCMMDFDRTARPANSMYLGRERVRPKKRDRRKRFFS